MNPIILFLTALAGTLDNRGQSDLGGYVALAALLYEEFGDASDEWKVLADEMKEYQEKGTDPSLERRQAVKDRRAELSAAIQGKDAST